MEANRHLRLTPRQFIDRRWKQLQCVHLLLPLIGIVVWKIANSEYHAYTGSSLVSMFVVYLALAYFLTGRIICSRCKNGVSMLTHDNNGIYYLLSPKVKCCPYCGEDFSSDEAPAIPSESGRTVNETIHREIGEVQPLTARQKIDAQWKRKPGTLSFELWSWLCFLSAVGYALIVKAPSLIYILLLGGSHIFNYLINHRLIRCPTCGNSVTDLEHRPKFLSPRLSEKVNLCPFCREDLSVNTPETE